MCENVADITTAFSALHLNLNPKPLLPAFPRLVTREDGTKELRTDCSHTGHVIALYLATRCEQCGVMFTSVR